MRAAAGFALVLVLGILAGGSTAGAAPTCGDVVLRDWEDGRIDGAYSATCYREALESMPEDVRVYTSATDDIARARREAVRSSARARRLSGRPAASAGTLADVAPAQPPTSSPAARSLPVPVLLAAVVVVLVGVAGSTSLVAKRVRRRRLAQGGRARS
jgi:hypothetical protein